MSAASHLRVVPSDLSFLGLLDAPAAPAEPAAAPAPQATPLVPVTPAAVPTAPPTAPAKAKKLDGATELKRIARERGIKPLMVGAEAAAEVEIDGKIVCLALESADFRAVLRGWYEEGGGGAISNAALAQAAATLADCARRAALAALPPAPQPTPGPSENLEEEARSEAAVAALRALVPRLRPAGGNELVAQFLQRRGLDVSMVTDLELGWALPHAELADAFAEFALGGAEDGVSGNWWATRHLLMVPFHDVDTDEVVSARARYCGLGVVEAAKKALAPSGCPVKGSWARCPRWGAYVRGEMPPPKTLIVCEGEVDWLTVVLAIHRRGLSVGVVGIVSGCWTERSAAKIPPGTRVVLLTHSDRAGCGYRDTIARSLGKRANLFVRHLFSSGDSKLPDENDIMRELGDKYDPRSSLHAWSAPPTVWPFTDVGNGERLIHRHGGDLRYCPSTSTWYAWAGTHWLVGNDAEVAVDAHVVETVRSMLKAEDPATPDEGKALASWAMLSESDTMVKRTMNRARTAPSIRIKIDQLDTHHTLLGVQNGVLDLEAGKLVADPRAALITRQAAATYDPDAKCPIWERSLLEIFRGDVEVVECFRRIWGYLLTGQKSKKLAVFCHGSGGDNGKSVLLKTTTKIFGDYGLALKPEILFDRKAGEREFWTATLEGKRVGVISEVEADAKLSASQLKRIAGGSDDLPSERKYHDPKSFENTSALVIAVNDIPPLPPDPRVLKRLLFLPFLRTFADPNEDLPLQWFAERDGILTWGVRGYLEYRERGIDPPEAVRAHSDGVKSDATSAEQFLASECVLGPGLEETIQDLHRGYLAWIGERQAAGQDIRPQNEGALGIRIAKLGCGSYRDPGTGRTIRTGIALKPGRKAAGSGQMPTAASIFGPG